MEKGAAKRFLGRPRESLRSLLLKPRFDAGIAYHFRREDFHPMPGVDTVLVHLRKKQTPDVPAPSWPAWERFVSEGLRGGMRLLRHSVSAAQWQRAMRAADAPGAAVAPCAADAPCASNAVRPRSAGTGAARDVPATPGLLSYVQWLCLFRCRPGRG
jgi:hypothetical protein